MAAMTSTLGQAKLGCSTAALRARQPAAARSAPIRTQAAAGGTALNEMVPDRWACACGHNRQFVASCCGAGSLWMHQKSRTPCIHLCKPAAP